MSRDKQKTEPIKESFVRTLSWFLKNRRRNQYGAKPILCAWDFSREWKLGAGGGGIVPDQVLQKEAAPRSLTDQFPFYILFRQKCENV